MANATEVLVDQYKGNIVASHAVGPGSIRSRVSILVDFSGVFPQL